MISNKKIGRAITIAVFLMSASPAALANWRWCCTDGQHAGGSAEGRCAGNQMTFASRSECEEHKKKHDAGTGHASTCTAK